MHLAVWNLAVWKLTNIVDRCSGTFIGNHYEEATNAISSLETELAAIKRELHITDENLAQYAIDEKTYLDNLKHTPITETVKVKYVYALMSCPAFSKLSSNLHVYWINHDLDECRHEWDLARAAANNAFSGPASQNINTVLLQLRRRVDAAYAKLQHGAAYVFSLEIQLQIQDRWSEDSPEYKHYKEEAVLQDYRAALDELERLVVMRLFELSKLGMSGTGKSPVLE
jgi:hypothetical protein